MKMYIKGREVFLEPPPGRRAWGGENSEPIGFSVRFVFLYGEPFHTEKTTETPK